VYAVPAALLCTQLARSADQTLEAAKVAYGLPRITHAIGIPNHAYNGPIDPDAWRTAVVRGKNRAPVTVQVRG
jgi:hypothetical protein